MTKKQKQQHGCGDVRMAAEVAYFINGNVGINPTSETFSLPKGRSGQRKGRFDLQENGAGFFRAYRENTGEKYEMLMQTANGGLMRTRPKARPNRAKLVAKLSFPIGMGSARLVEQLVEQVNEMVGFLRTREIS